MRYRAVLPVLFLLLAGIAFGVAEWARPTKLLADELGKLELARVIPEQVGDWRLVESPIPQIESPDQKTLLDSLYDQILVRTYVNAKGDAVMLNIAYGLDQRDGKSAHRPEICYPAQGLNIFDKRNITFKVGKHDVPAVSLRASHQSRNEYVYYWLITGDQVVTWGKQRGVVNLGYGLRGFIPDGMIFRASVLGSDPVHAQQATSDFVNQLSKVLSPKVRERIFGA